MSESVLFSLFAGVAIVSALAVLLLRQALQTVLAAVLNIIAVLALFVLLQVPIIALIQFVVMMLLMAGTVQMVRSFGPQRFVTRRHISFGQVLSLLVSVLLGALILLHISTVSGDEPERVMRPLWVLPLTTESVGLLALASLLFLAALVGFRFVVQMGTKDS